MDFEEWLDEYVNWFGEAFPRRVCIARFVRKGLVPFLSENGYTIGRSTDCLGNYIANGLFENSGLSHLDAEWRYPAVNIHGVAEDRWHYNFVIDGAAWEGFWNVWGGWGDLSELEFRGEDRRMDIQEFIWTQINLEGSRQTAELYEIMLGGEEDDTNMALSRKQVNDTYLQESVEYNGWGGYRK